MSPRAAWRLERLGFVHVSDYEGGKMDWLSHGLPHEGSALLAGDVLDRSVATYDLDDCVGRMTAAAEDRRDEMCVAVTDGDVVMGVVRGSDADADDQRRVEDVTRFGVSTVRASEDLEALVGRMGPSGRDAVLVTSPDARLLGLLRRADAEAALRRHHEEDR